MELVQLVNIAIKANMSKSCFNNSLLFHFVLPSGALRSLKAGRERKLWVMRWTGFRAQLTSSVWQALMQRTLTEASFLDFRRTDGINEKEEGWKEMGRKRWVCYMHQGKRNTDRQTDTHHLNKKSVSYYFDWSDMTLKPMTGDNTYYLILMAPVKGWVILGNKWTVEFDVMEAGKMR